MRRSLRGGGLGALSIGFAVLPFAFSLIRAFETRWQDLRYIWVALAGLGGAATIMAVAGLRGNRLNPGAALFTAVFVSATVLAVIAALLLGTTLGAGIAVVGSAFGLCFAVGCVLHVLARD